VIESTHKLAEECSAVFCRFFDLPTVRPFIRRRALDLMVVHKLDATKVSKQANVVQRPLEGGRQLAIDNNAVLFAILVCLPFGVIIRMKLPRWR
jgi:hypothetical protein